MNALLDRLAPVFSTWLNLVIDLLLLLAALGVSTWLSQRPIGSASHELFWFAVAATSVWVVTSTALRHYDPYAPTRDATDDAALVTILVMAVTTLLAVVNLAVTDEAAIPTVGKFLLVFWPSALLLRLGLFRRVAHKGGPIDEALVIGIGPMGRLTGEDLEKRGRTRVVGYLHYQDESLPGASLSVSMSAPPPSRILGPAQELEVVLRTVPVSEVYIAGNARKHSNEMQTAIAVCEKLGVPFALPAYNFRLERARPVDSSAVSDGYLHYQSFDPKPHQMALKRLFDIVASATALWMLLPLFVVVAAIIRVTSRGPVFFKQKRVGVHGQPFHMLKFRSMVINAEELKAKLMKVNEQSGPVFKMKNDPRVTRIGRFIRKYSIDELPQLINVLRGDMSIVGPRPPVPAEVAKYEAWQRRRLSVRPGLTCIWQVSGRNQISFEDWMYLDMQYIDHWSLAQDFNLIFRTVPVVLTGRGAS